jgi:hypothetical protein
VIWRRKRRGGDPDVVLREARTALDDLRQVLAVFRDHLDELEAEVKRQPLEPEEA